MRAISRSTLQALALVAAAALGAGTAEAKCKRMGFLVNDYGKDGPTKDAQDLLDKHVATWATENGIAKYTIGKKDVTCELFLNFIVFDEHTCTASANVCWDEPGAGGTEKTAAGADKTEKKKVDEKKAAETKPDEKKADEAKPSGKSSKAPESTSDDAAKASEPVKDAPKAPTASPVETGTLPSSDPAPAKPAVDPDAAEKAAAAAERAAAAAERAAEAAERAAKAAAEKSAPAPAPAPASQLEMPGFGAGAAKVEAATPATVDPVKPSAPKP